ncbi:MAG: protein kinase [Acidobacteriota bacterium]
MAIEKIGRYEIKGLLGQGTMGVVYKAYDPLLDRYAAIKVMNTSGKMEGELRTRFFREARSVAKLNHPNIISIYDMGEDKKRPFIAMEYVEGEDLKAIIGKRVFIPFKQKLGFVSQICDGLDYAHSKGVVHRDIKPGNVFIMRDGGLKILDFGLARLASSEITESGMLLGSPYYMSPEQIKGRRNVDGRSDFFSLGVVLYELISYSRPFEGETPTSVCFQIVSEPHHPISVVLPGCAAELAQIIDRALSKDREARYQTGSELAAALLRFQDQLPSFQDTLKQDIEALQAELEKGREEFNDPLVHHLVDDALFEAGKLPPESKVPIIGSPTSPDDYGSLLLRQADLKRRLERVAERQSKAQKILELFGTARKQLEDSQLDACRASLEEILKLNPENSEALRMRETLEECRHERETQLQLHTALEVARSALDQEDFERCLKVASTALEIDPTHAEALALKGTALEGLKLQKVEELLAAARQHERTQDYESCHKSAAEALELDPENAELKEIQRHAQEEIEKRRKVTALLEEARQGLQTRVYNQALEAAEEVLVLEPKHAEALELKRSALEARVKVTSLLSEARKQLEAGHHKACYQTTAKGLELDPEHPELKDLHEQAAKHPSVQKEHQSHIAELLDFTRSEIKRGDFESALRNLSFLLELEPDHPEALMLKQQAEVALREEKEASKTFEATQILEENTTLAIEPKPRKIWELKVPFRISAVLGKPWLRSSVRGLFVVLLVLVVVIWWAGGDQPESELKPLPEIRMGSLILNVAPWANVESIRRLNSVYAISIDQDLSTPCVVPMPGGRYRVRVSNPHFNETLEFEVTIVPGQPSVVHKKLPAFDLEEELSSAIGNQPGS